MTTKQTDQLYDAFLSLETREECRRFFADLCTPKEINDFTDRLEIARLLKDGGMSYREISKSTNASTTTVARVARFLTQESYQGYSLILDRLNKRS